MAWFLPGADHGQRLRSAGAFFVGLVVGFLPSLLVIAGVVVGLVPGIPPVRVTPDVVSLVVLPPLLYAASEELPWRDLLAVWRPVLVRRGPR